MPIPTGAAPAPSTPLGPFVDSALAWTTWITSMGLVGFSALALLVAGPAAWRIGDPVPVAVTSRLARIAVPLGVLAVPAALTGLAHDGSATGGYDYSAVWNLLYDGTGDGLLSGLQLTLSLVAAALLAPLMWRRVAAGPARTRLLGGGLAAGAASLGTTKFPTDASDGWSRTIFQTAVWMCHLWGGAIWIGGLAGLLVLALPGGVPSARRGAFWSVTIRRFSGIAMTCVAAIALSGLFLYWDHVDGPSQLLSTMYGRVLGVKILIFGALLLLGVVNQFWLHPRIEALRAGGDERPLRTIVVRRFPAVVAVELLLGMTVLFVAPFLHGSARNQAFQADAATHGAPVADLPKIPDKKVRASTWVWGSAETVIVVALMVGGYRVSGRLARRRRTVGAAVTEY